MSTPYRVALLGFSAFERNALASYFRLATNRVPRYEASQVLSDADLMVADADHTPSVELVSAIERLDDTVFIGARPPSQARASLERPVEPGAVMRELDALLAGRGGQAPRREEPARESKEAEPPPRPSVTAPPEEGEDKAPLDLKLRSEPLPIRSAAPSTPGVPRRSADTRPARPGPLAAALSGFPPIVPPALPPVAPRSPDAIYPPLATPVAESIIEPPATSTPASIDPPAAPMSLAGPGTATPAEATMAAAPTVRAPAPPTPPGAPPKAEPARAPAAAPRPPAPGAMRTAAARRAAVAPAPATSKVRALVVDDSEIAQRFLQLRLERFGLLIDCATTSEVALSLLTRHSYDFAFLDVELGEASRLDGLALCQAIKRHYATRVPPITVVLVTAHVGELERVRGTLAGCDAFLGKPLDEASLDRLLTRHGLARKEPASPV